MLSEIAEFRDFAPRKVHRNRGVALPALGGHGGMSHASHSPSFLRSSSDGAGLSGGMLDSHELVNRYCPGRATIIALDHGCARGRSMRAQSNR
jgi:hypothetical protein